MNSVVQMFDLALRHHRAGDLHQAESLYRQILQVDPRHADVLHMLGVMAYQVGNNDLAVDSIQRALSVHPQFPVAYNNLGLARMAQGKLEEALSNFQQALVLKPDYAEAHNNLGIVLSRQGKLDEAITSYQQAVRLNPNIAEAHYNLGTALAARERLEEAVAAFQQALRLKPEYADAYNNLGNVLRDQGKFAAAVVSYRHCLRLRPDYAEAHNNLGLALAELGNKEEGIASLGEAIRLQPNHADAHLNRAMQLLRLGNFAEGWAEFEWRWQTKPLNLGSRHFSQPPWRGNPLPQGTILLHAEQGLGDTIQFIRFAALVKQYVGTVLCECQPGLARLLRSCAGIDRIIPLGEPLPPFDVHAPLLSLPRILKTTLETIPARIPYLHADAPHPSALVPVFNIGIAWQGNPRTLNAELKRSDGRRSIPLARFEPLARVPGVRLISLQKGAGAEQLQDLAGRFPVVDLGSTCDDFSDTAAVMKSLDLVISVDSSPAHLAGALGVPVWVALPSVSCWRWLTQREDSPWYPTMRLFRQTALGDWSDVFERMARELRGLVP